MNASDELTKQATPAHSSIITWLFSKTLYDALSSTMQETHANQIDWNSETLVPHLAQKHQ